MSNLGRLVKWQDGKGEQGGGWHTGYAVLAPDGREVVHYLEVVDYGRIPHTLVQTSCTKDPIWALSDKLETYETREERAAKGQE